MIFIETPVFTKDAQVWLPDDEYGALQTHLAAYPLSGPVIPGTGGLRKLRWKVGGKGKRGGVRVIYYPLLTASRIWLILIYRKSLKDDLTPSEKRLLKGMIKEWPMG